MLLEIENQLHKKVHTTLGQSAVVLRLAEELDSSGRVAEQTMIIVSWTSGNTTNPYEGAGIPTVRRRSLSYTLTLVQKQVQREGHSFALPILDLLADAITGWIPEVPGLEFQTGFELKNERFVKITEDSQFIYEQVYSVDISMVDGRFFSHPCASFGPLFASDFLPKRSGLVTPDGVQTGLAVWRRKLNSEETEEYIVDQDPKFVKNISDYLEVSCNAQLDGSATYTFVPHQGISYDSTGQKVFDPSKTTSGNLFKVWKCYKTTPSSQPVPPWFKLNIDFGLWRNETAVLPNQDPGTSAIQPFSIQTQQ